MPEAAGQEQLTSVGSEAVRREQLNICWCRAPLSQAWPEYQGYDDPVRIYDRDVRTEKLPERIRLMELWEKLYFYED